MLALNAGNSAVNNLFQSAPGREEIGRAHV